MEAFILLVAGIVAGAVAGAFGMRWKVRREPVADTRALPHSSILSTVDGGYYWHSVVTGEEECSPRLHHILGLTDYDESLDSIYRILGEAHSTVLRQAIDRLPYEKTPMLLTMNMQGGSQQLECIVSGIRDAQDTLSEYVVWFRDTTSSQKHAGRLVKENGQLKRDIKQFSNILNVLPTPVWLRAADYAVRYCNMAYSEAAEESHERSAAQEALELHPAARALAKAAMESGEMKAERRHIIIGGTRKLYQFSEIPLASEHIVVGIAQDVTELETVQEELQRHINAQSELLESVTSAMAVFGADMRLKFFNYAYVRLWGFDEAWLSTEPTYSELLETLRDMRRLPEQANFPQFKQRHLKMFTDLIESREEIFYLPDGRTLRVLAIPHALGGILFAYEDVTDRLALERSYNTLIAVQKATLDNLHEGVVVFGEDGRLRLTNPRFLHLWKLENAVLSPETHISDLIEKTSALHHTDDWENYKQNFIAHLLVREVQTKRIERTDGSVLDSVVVPLPDGATLITFSDVTDSMVVERTLRERNDALQEVDRLKTEFLANVSYELRSPLTSISGFSEMLKQDYFGELSPKQREYVGGIHTASQHLMHLINDILDIASIEAGYMKLDVAEFDIHAMLQSVVSLVQERIRERQIQFTFRCPRRIGKLLADETRMKQIMFNLLSNAVKYSEIRGEILMSAEILRHDDKADEAVMFTIEDNGIGITPHEQEAVFSKFYKGSNAGIHKSGAGLGLSMVKSLIELHGGKVELHSMPGQGTRIACILPRRNPHLLEHATYAIAVE
jgi:signal transduction histidine kinase